jgi:hypothetical protein
MGADQKAPQIFQLSSLRLSAAGATPTLAQRFIALPGERVDHASSKRLLDKGGYKAGKSQQNCPSEGHSGIP